MKRNNKKLDSKDPRYMTEEQEQIVNLILSNSEEYKFKCGATVKVA